MTKSRSRFLKWVLAAGIVIVLNLLFNYTIQLFYESPKYETFCKQEQVTIAPATQDECVAKGGAWTENRVYEPVPAKTIDGKVITGYCDEQYTCRKEYETVRESYERNVFIILVILGVLSVLAGFLVKEFEAVSLGLSLGGVLSFIIGSIRYWGSAPSIVRVLILVIALGILIYLGIKKISE